MQVTANQLPISAITLPRERLHFVTFVEFKSFSKHITFTKDEILYF